MDHLFALGFAFLISRAYGLDVGTRVAHWTGLYNRVAFDGYLVTFALSWAAGYAIWPFARQLANALVFGPAANAGLMVKRAMTTKTAPLAVDNDASLNPLASITYQGLVNRDFGYDDKGRFKEERVRSYFTLNRSISVMPPREQLAAQILQMFESEDLLKEGAVDRLKFALAWGDGRTSVTGGPMRISGQCARQNNVHSLTDLVQLEARHRGASSDGAVTDLFTLLQHAAARIVVPESVRQMHQRLVNPGGEVWR